MLDGRQTLSCPAGPFIHTKVARAFPAHIKMHVRTSATPKLCYLTTTTVSASDLHTCLPATPRHLAEEIGQQFKFAAWPGQFAAEAGYIVLVSVHVSMSTLVHQDASLSAEHTTAAACPPSRTKDQQSQANQFVKHSPTMQQPHQLHSNQLPRAAVNTGGSRHTIAVTSRPALPKSDANVWAAGTAGLRFTRPKAAAASAAADVSMSGATTRTG